MMPVLRIKCALIPIYPVYDNGCTLGNRGLRFVIIMKVAAIAIYLELSKMFVISTAINIKAKVGGNRFAGTTSQPYQYLVNTKSLTLCK